MPQVRVVKMRVGAEVLDVSPDAVTDPAIQRALYGAWLRYGVLLFRGVDSIAAHVAYSRVFGQLEMHPLPQWRDPEEPLLMPLGDGMGPAYVYDDETEAIGGRLSWHRDTAYTPGIAKGAMLRMRAVPARDGQTLFADTAMAYDELPSDVQRRIDGLEYRTDFQLQFTHGGRPGTLWSTSRFATDEESTGNSIRLARSVANTRSLHFPAVLHPVVAEHPESGRKCLFISPKDADCIVGVSSDESRELLAYLIAHMTDARYVYMHEWSIDDAIVWDNRRMIHAASGYSVHDHRHGQRTTLKGQFDSGRLCDPAADHELAPVR